MTQEEGTGSRFRIDNVTRGTRLAARSRQATNPISRGIGLIGRRGLAPDDGLIIRPCNGVVSFFMRFTIDVVFIDATNTVVSVLPSMVPWRMSSIVRGSKAVIELPAGKIAETGTEAGDAISITPL